MSVTQFELRDPQSGLVLARGVEDVAPDGSGERRQTSYSQPDGARVHSETYRTGPSGRLEHYSFSSPTGESVDARRVASGSLEVEYREKAGATPRKARLPLSDRTLIGKEVPATILKNWDQLVKGETVTFDLVVPSLLETIEFRVRLDPEASRSPDTRTFIVEANHWIVRQFAPDLSFTFAGRRLKEFSGPSPIDLGGERYRKVHVVMTGD